jgi:hypothetical protein
MNRLRWIFGIPVAFAIIFCILLLNAYVEPSFYENQLFLSISQYYHPFSNLVCCSMLVFLSCLFVPTKRKYAAIVAVLIISCLIGASFIFTVLYNKIYRLASINLLLNYAGIFAGLLVGMCVSYQVFKNRGWSKANILEEDKEDY